MWFEVALIALIFAVGNVLFGHFEERTPKWRRVAKIFVVIGIGVGISHTFGRLGFYLLLGAMALLAFVVHGWWLPKHGINGWTGEPKDKYYDFRGWRR